MGFTSIILLLALLKPTIAHLPLAYKPERLRQETDNAAGSWAASNRNEEDFSLENPFDIYAALYKNLFPLELPSRNPSAALFIPSRLIDKEDVDYYMYDTSNSNVSAMEGSGRYQNMYDFVSYCICNYITVSTCHYLILLTILCIVL